MYVVFQMLNFYSGKTSWRTVRTCFTYFTRGTKPLTYLLYIILALQVQCPIFQSFIVLLLAYELLFFDLQIKLNKNTHNQRFLKKTKTKWRR